MKNILSFLIVLVLATAFGGTGAGLHAQTNTNAFVVTLSSNSVIQPAIPAVMATSVTIDRIMVDNVAQRLIIFPHNAAPIVISGANFAAFKAAVGPTFKTVIAGLIQSNP